MKEKNGNFEFEKRYKNYLAPFHLFFILILFFSYFFHKILGKIMFEPINLGIITKKT